MQQYTAGTNQDPQNPAPFSPPIFFAHSHYCVNAGQNAPWNRSTPYSIDFTVPEPVPFGSGVDIDIINGPFYRNSRTRPRDVTDGLSQTVFAGETDSILTNKTWVGVVPGACTPSHVNPTIGAGDNNGAGCLVSIHSGPDVHERPQFIIHQPSDPIGLTDEMFSEHAGWTGCNVLFGDGSRPVHQCVHRRRHVVVSVDDERRRRAQHAVLGRLTNASESTSPPSKSGGRQRELKNG